jgi:glycosyltransferase involved in cell wall biosynthesis
MLSLVVVCARNVFYERFKKKLKQMKAERFVNLVGFVPDRQLAVLYSQAKAFVFPSLMEGFGLPGLEAMACGCPVAASNSSCLPEVYGRAALYFDPLDVEDMTNKILKVTRNTSTRNKLVKRGFKQVKKYSWRKMARETLVVYRSVLKKD